MSELPTFTIAEMNESNRLAADNFKRAKLAEAEVKRLRAAIRDLHRVWSAGADLDKDAVAAACLRLFVIAAQNDKSQGAEVGSVPAEFPALDYANYRLATDLSRASTSTNRMVRG